MTDEIKEKRKPCEPFDKCWFCRELIDMVRENFNETRAKEVEAAMKAFHIVADLYAGEEALKGEN